MLAGEVGREGGWQLPTTPPHPTSTPSMPHLTSPCFPQLPRSADSPPAAPPVSVTLHPCHRPVSHAVNPFHRPPTPGLPLTVSHPPRSGSGVKKDKQKEKKERVSISWHVCGAFEAAENLLHLRESSAAKAVKVTAAGLERVHCRRAERGGTDQKQRSCSLPDACGPSTDAAQTFSWPPTMFHMPSSASVCLSIRLCSRLPSVSRAMFRAGQWSFSNFSKTVSYFRNKLKNKTKNSLSFLLTEEDQLDPGDGHAEAVLGQPIRLSTALVGLPHALLQQAAWQPRRSLLTLMSSFTEGGGKLRVIHLIGCWAGPPCGSVRGALGERFYCVVHRGSAARVLTSQLNPMVTPAHDSMATRGPDLCDHLHFRTRGCAPLMSAVSLGSQSSCHLIS
ncbi:hypothetical protein JZ751_014560 [Albula glossodonta]|uniref:Uncharacterized protein n=1 Tax=Albula glossodonta TaxID=121402 RepID=A0A8T2N446_9TELE|nr:hypothetical protein JZ751_014560 [Albula glossodonta]